jgi:hypothetical protein
VQPVGLLEYTMFRRMSVTFVLACPALLAAGCGSGAATREAAATAARANVTLHVEGMTERLRLT